MLRRPALALLALSAALLSIPQASAQTYFKASTPGSMDNFGWTVTAWGDTVAVGAMNEDSNSLGINGNETNNSAVDSGAVYVFVKGGIWSQQAYIKASNTDAGDKFSGSVSLYGDTLAVGATGEASNASGINGNQSDDSLLSSGAVYVFERAGGMWSQQAYIKASNPGMNDGFGLSVSISGDTLVVGAPNEASASSGVNGNQSDNSAIEAGAAYVFVRNGFGWTQQAYLKASNTQGGDNFGTKVAVFGDTIVVTAPDEASGATGVNGDETSNSKLDSGAAYVFVRNGTTWSQQAYLKASNTGAGDAFGESVAIEGDTIVVGTTQEDSPATGVNGNEASDAAPTSGAAYVFVRSGTTWTQQAYLKASNTQSLDQFGNAVSVSGDRIVVGARFEGSNATGVNGDQSNNSAVNAGAVYSFVRSGTTWTQQAYIKASNTGSQDQFGTQVAVSGDMLVATAYREDSNEAGVGGTGLNNLLAESGAAYVYELPPTGPWTNMGSGLAGVSGVPSLVGSGTLADGSLCAIDLANAAPSAPAALFVALAGTPTPFKGGTLLPVPSILMVQLPTSAVGAISLPFVMPSGLPTGTQLWMQWAIQDAAAVKGAALSNALRGVTP